MKKEQSLIKRLSHIKPAKKFILMHRRHVKNQNWDFRISNISMIIALCAIAECLNSVAIAEYIVQNYGIDVKLFR